MALDVTKGSCSRWFTTLARTPHVLVVAYAILAETMEGVLLFRVLGIPVFHALQHFSLHFRLGVMEFGMEPDVQRRQKLQ